MRTIKMAPGIGDAIFIFQLLVNCGERFHFQISDGFPQRGKQIFDLLPQVAASCTYVKGLHYKRLNKGNIQRYRKTFKAIRERDFYLCCNEWLEQGNRLEGFLPDLPISYKIDWQTSEEDQSNAALLMNRLPISIGVYGSAYSTQRNWKEYGAWELPQWVELIRLIHKERPKAVFIIIGAEWDTDFADALVAVLKKEKIPYKNTVGYTLGHVIEIMKYLDYAFYFPSGLPILSETLEGGGDCTMFYGSNLEKLMGTWSDPARKGAFNEMQFTEPGKVFEWVRDEYKLFEKI